MCFRLKCHTVMSEVAALQHHQALILEEEVEEQGVASEAVVVGLRLAMEDLSGHNLYIVVTTIIVKHC